jgi:FkbM family methyltransferase
LAVCIEPDSNNIEIGRRNTALNGNVERVRFIEAWVGGESLESHAAPTETSAEPRALPMLDASSLLAHCGSADIELLHLDVQGAELPFLRSLGTAGARDRLRFIMVSTHHSSISGSSTTHVDCVETLRGLGAVILVEHDVIESYSGDGLILASVRAEDRDLWFPEISRNRAQTSLFKSA